MTLTVLITGASDGIAAAAARQLAPHGHRLLITGRSRDKLESVARETGATPFVADYARLDDVRRLAEDVRAELGGDGLDVLANNAGGIFGDPATGTRRPSRSTTSRRSSSRSCSGIDSGQGRRPSSTPRASPIASSETSISTIWTTSEHSPPTRRMGMRNWRTSSTLAACTPATTTRDSLPSPFIRGPSRRTSRPRRPAS